MVAPYIPDDQVMDFWWDSFHENEENAWLAVVDQTKFNQSQHLMTYLHNLGPPSKWDCPFILFPPTQMSLTSSARLLRLSSKAALRTSTKSFHSTSRRADHYLNVDLPVRTTTSFYFHQNSRVLSIDIQQIGPRKNRRRGRANSPCRLLRRVRTIQIVNSFR